jgi:hypothetical protein
MPRRLYKGDPLTPDERAAYEEDLISFCDRELDLLGDIEGLVVLYAGGSSVLWLEGLSQRIGRNGTLTALEADAGRVEEGRELLRRADLAAPVRLLARDASVVRPGGRVATSDFVDSAPAVQLEDEESQRELAREISGAQFYGVGSPDRLVAHHEALLTKVRWRVSPPHPVRYLDRIVLTEDEPEELRSLPVGTRRRLRERREALRERIRREGYTRLATLYVEGCVPG